MDIHRRNPALRAGATAEDVVPRLLRAADILEYYVRVSLDTLNNWVNGGSFPQPDLRTGRERLWTRDAVDAWYQDVIAKGEL